jgi:hypothetical protein
VNAHYAAVARRAQHRCEYCLAPEVVFNGQFEVEHVLPTALGGADEPGNLALACRVCNARKSAAVLALDPKTGNEVPLFNPRTEKWDEHFRFDPESARIVGLTETGRATVARLDMNHPQQLGARLLWVQLRLFP